MRKRRMMRELAALGHAPFTPSDEMRQMVKILVVNDTPHERIATILEISLIELQYHFAKELELAKDELLAISAARMIELARQKLDLGVAFRANELILKTRSKAWRIPAEEAVDGKPIESMSLTEVDQAIERLERERRNAAAAADPEAATVDVEGQSG